MSWSRKFAKPIRTSTGKRLTTLADARAFMLALDDRTSRNEWQRAAEKLLAASKRGGDIQAARDALVNALFLNMMLDLEHEKKKE